MGTPGPVEILRAAQKDNIFIEKFSQDVQEIVEALIGKAHFLKWRNSAKLGAMAIYFSLTNLSGYQTLGEEYAGLVLTDSSRRRSPTKRMITQMILLQIFGQTLFQKGLKYLSEFLSKNKSQSIREVEQQQSHTCTDNALTSSNAIQSGTKVIRAAGHCFPFLLQLHLVIFYVQGKFYHVSKRLSGIHYVLVRSWFANQDENSQKNLKYLRLMSIINLVLTAIHDSVRFLNSQQKQQERKTTPVKLDETNDSSEKDPTRKCSLCLETRKNPTLAQCGHLYCWDCIMDWIRTREQCPICRFEITPSRLVPLQNHF